jgi:hypothetical protein
MRKPKNGVMKILIAVGVLLGLFASAWGGSKYLNDNYVPREVFILQCEAQIQMMQQMQKDRNIDRARSNYEFWQRRESDYRWQLSKEPTNQWLKENYEEAKRQRIEAERHLRQIESK